MLNDPKKVGRLTNGLVSALYLAAAVLLGLLLYFTVKGIRPGAAGDQETHLNAPFSKGPASSRFAENAFQPQERTWQAGLPHGSA